MWVVGEDNGRIEVSHIYRCLIYSVQLFIYCNQFLSLVAENSRCDVVDNFSYFKYALKTKSDVNFLRNFPFRTWSFYHFNLGMK